MKKIIAILLFLAPFSFVAAQAVSTPSVDIVWEAQTYTPASYQGRSLASPGSLAKVVAITSPGGGALTYYWRKDGLDIKSASGAGRDTFTYRAGDAVGGINLIEVAAARADGTIIDTASARIPIVTPKIVFYEIKDGQIDYRRAVKNLNIAADQTKIIAEPFYFSTTDWLTRRLVFNWSMGEQKIVPATEDPRFLTFITGPDSGAGERTVDLKITNNSRQFQIATAKLPVKFGLSSFGF